MAQETPMQTIEVEVEQGPEHDGKQVAGGTVFLQHPDVPGKQVSFGVRLESVCGQHVMKDVLEHGLAYSAGFRTDDVLLEINSTNIEEQGLENLLDLLCNQDQPLLLLAVGRNFGEAGANFIWTKFKVVIKDGIETTEVIRTIQNHQYVRGWYDLVSADEVKYSYLGKSDKPYDIFIEGSSPPRYLSIVNEEVKFITLSNATTGTCSRFYRYQYGPSGENPSDGAVVAFSLQSSPPYPEPPEKNSPAGALTDVAALIFPECMTGKEPIKPNPRFWYEKSHDDDFFTLQWVMAQDKCTLYLNVASDGETAVLSQEKLKLKIEFSEDKEDTHCCSIF